MVAILPRGDELKKSSAILNPSGAGPIYLRDPDLVITVTL